jgi:hypothetical protein
MYDIDEDGIPVDKDGINLPNRTHEPDIDDEYSYVSVNLPMIESYFNDAYDYEEEGESTSVIREKISGIH